MPATRMTSKHRAAEPVPVAVRPGGTGVHRAARESDPPVAAILGIILLVLAAYLATRG